MAKANLINVVATECAAGKEEFFNKWYNETHIPMLMKYKGIKKVTRYKLTGEVQGQAKYLAIYEFADKQTMDHMHHTKEFAAAMEEMQGTWKGDNFLKWAAPYEPIKSWEQ